MAKLTSILVVPVISVGNMSLFLPRHVRSPCLSRWIRLRLSCLIQLRKNCQCSLHVACLRIRSGWVPTMAILRMGQRATIRVRERFRFTGTTRWLLKLTLKFPIRSGTMARGVLAEPWLVRSITVATNLDILANPSLARTCSLQALSCEPILRAL